MNFEELVAKLPLWHPVKTYFSENTKLNSLLHQLSEVDTEKDFQLFFNIFNQVAEIDKRYTRKENQLFPYLEKYGWNGPSQGMWAFHDANRDIVRAIRKNIEEKKIEEVKNLLPMLVGELQRMMLVEEKRLLPYAFELLKEEDWKEMRIGEEEIGWAFGIRPLSIDEASLSPATPAAPIASAISKTIQLSEGFMSPEQINLMLQFLPVDLTYVDEHDRVLFYNRGEERVFPRSAAVIGREVRFCHPPKSVGTVLKILEEFKKGTKDDAEFWIDYRGKKIHIRYFAIRDAEKNYKGVIEVSQDITHIQKLVGEQRLLSWS